MIRFQSFTRFQISQFGQNFSFAAKTLERRSTLRKILSPYKTKKLGNLWDKNLGNLLVVNQWFNKHSS